MPKALVAPRNTSESYGKSGKLFNFLGLPLSNIVRKGRDPSFVLLVEFLAHEQELAKRLLGEAQFQDSFEQNSSEPLSMTML